MVDALDLGSSVERRASSSLALGIYFEWFELPRPLWQTHPYFRNPNREVARRVVDLTGCLFSR